MNHVEVKNLVFSYIEDKPVIKDISFTIEKGSYTTLIGHNGSGKSTIAKLLMGLLEADSGEIIISGKVLSEETVEEIRSMIGIVFQNPDNQFIGATVEDDIAFGLENNQTDPELMKDIIYKFANEVGMRDHLHREPESLSGGQKQRVAIAGVLAMAPDLIIFDESTSMLDPKGKREIKELITRIHEEKQITVISITHDIEEVVQSDYVYILNEGKIALSGRPEDVLINEKQLIEIQLDIPFALKMSSKIKKAGIDVNKNIKIEGLVENLCQLR